MAAAPKSSRSNESSPRGAPAATARDAAAFTSLEDIFQLGIAHQNAKQLPQALDCFQRVARANSEHLHAWCRLAACHEAQHQWSQACDAYDRAVQLAPEFAELHCNRGMVLLRVDQPAAAREAFQRALALKSTLAEAWNGLGVARKNLGELDAAEAAFRRAHELRPAYPEFLYNLGNALQLQEKWADAIQVYRHALAAAPRHADLLHNLGCAQCGARDFAAAIQSLEQAVANFPAHADAWNQLGTAHAARGDFAAAQDAFHRALQLRAENPDVLCNLGNLYLAQNDPTRALAHYTRARTKKPGFAPARFNCAIAHLLRGEWKSGFELYEARWESEQKKFRRSFAAPLWNGSEALEGKTVLLHAEQGIGDTLQFVRYAPHLAQRGARVLLEVQPALVPWFREQFGREAVFPKYADDLPPFDFHCPMLSLPRALVTEIESVPREIPYLRVSADAAARWADTLAHQARPRVGLVVSGNAKHRNDHHRSIPLHAFRALLHQTVASFHLIQKDLKPADQATLADIPELTDWSAELTDFGETAALVANLDLIISVDTSVAHLAGALGKPVWLLLPFAPDWRWMLEREDSPWYPTMRLFRQPRPGDWSSVLARIEESLRTPKNLSLTLTPNLSRSR